MTQDHHPLPDTTGNRSARKWSRRALAGRVLWALLGRPLFALSPRPLWGFRRALLRLFGARVGSQVHIYPSVRITIPWNLTLDDSAAVGGRAMLYALGPIKIGAQATISQNAHLCAGSHEYRDPTLPLTKPPITIGAGAWICADAFVGPGVTVGARAILAARGVAVRDLAPGTVHGGNPARLIKMRDTIEPGQQ